MAINSIELSNLIKNKIENKTSSLREQAKSDNPPVNIGQQIADASIEALADAIVEHILKLDIVVNITAPAGIPVTTAGTAITQVGATTAPIITQSSTTG